MLNTVTGVPEWGLIEGHWWEDAWKISCHQVSEDGKMKRQNLGENYKQWAGHDRKKPWILLIPGKWYSNYRSLKFPWCFQPVEIDLYKTNQIPFTSSPYEKVSSFSPSFLVSGGIICCRWWKWLSSQCREAKNRRQKLSRFRQSMEGAFRPFCLCGNEKLKQSGKILLCWSHCANFRALWTGENVFSSRHFVTGLSSGCFGGEHTKFCWRCSVEPSEFRD